MVTEQKLTHTVGHTRQRILDESNNFFVRGDLASCNKHLLINFLQTIDEGKNPEIAKEIRDGLDKDFALRKAQRDELNTTIKNIGYLEEKDLEQEFRTIDEEFTSNIKATIWRITLKYNLTYDR